MRRVSVQPAAPSGPALVVPRAEIDHWLDLESGLLDHLAKARAGHRQSPEGASRRRGSE